MPDLRQGCASGKQEENTAPADALVLFGAMGDLAYKKIFPALYNMLIRQLSQHFHLLVGTNFISLKINPDCENGIEDELHRRRMIPIIATYENSARKTTRSVPADKCQSGLGTDRLQRASC